MTRGAEHRWPIAPLGSQIVRPLWSVMIPAFNCAAYLRETLRSVLAQDLGPHVMQIEVVDDCSTDDAGAVVAAVGAGRVEFYRQARNVGVPHNFYTCIERARGHLVHLLHGDDLVLPGFYAGMGRAFGSHPEIGAAFCRHVFIDSQGQRGEVSDLEEPQSGILRNALERLALQQRIMTPSIVVRREVYEALGAFDSRLTCAEDWEMWVRIAAHYPIWYETELLAAYRMHGNSNTGRHTHTAEDMRYTRLAIELFEAHLPADHAARIAGSARRAYSLAAVENARLLWEQNDRSGAIAQAREALALSRSPRTLWALARLAVRGLRT